MNTKIVCKIELTATRVEGGIEIENHTEFHGSLYDKMNVLRGVLEGLRLSKEEATLVCALACSDMVASKEIRREVVEA